MYSSLFVLFQIVNWIWHKSKESMWGIKKIKQNKVKDLFIFESAEK